MILSVFGAAGMREARTGAGFRCRRLESRFGAVCGPPARGVLWQIAHFQAATMRAGFRAVAITASGGDASDAIGGVSEKRPGCGKQHRGNSEQMRSGFERKRDPGPKHKRILRKLARKTDRSE